MMKVARIALLALSLGSVALLYAGCEVDSADEFLRNVTTDFSGFYDNPNGGNVVEKNSGAAITSLDLRQTGDRLEAVDNNGSIWRGTLGEVRNGTTSFSMEGRTTDGTEGTFSGTLSSSDGGTSASGTTASVQGTMQGTYIEFDRFSTFYATATIPGTSGGGDGDGDGTGVSISPDSGQITNSTGSITLNASGGTSPYSWSITSGGGTLSSTSGDSTTYNRNGAADGTAVIRVQDSDGDTDTATITLL